MKSEVLRALKENREGYISGEALSNSLNVSRTAVWKAIKQLKEQGYVIESATRKGYRLMESIESLNKEELESELESTLVKNVITFDSIDSTNMYAKKIAAEGVCEGTLILADEQTHGKGRLGRQWHSEKNSGIWMSIVLRPEIRPENAAKITQIAAAAMAEAIRKIAEIEVGIKWPNDIVYKGKKVCGILTEMSAELGAVNYVVVGVGVNVNTEGFSDEIKEIATSLKHITGKVYSRKDIVIEFINRFEKLYGDFVQTGQLTKTIDICKALSVVLGEEIEIISRNSKEYGKAIDLDHNGHLIVEKDNGEIKEVFYGEISIRGNFYKGAKS